MTIDELIKHCEEVAEENEKSIVYYIIQGDKEGLDECEKDCIECAKEHRQLAKWLKELKAYREILANHRKIIESLYGCVIVEGYVDVVDRMNDVFMEANADDTIEEEILKAIRKVRTMEEEEAIWKQQEELREELRIEKEREVTADDRN